ncbi:hypothetical protein XENORESO_005033 [Xenotaenia resolanae]|uniref:C2H2-type domain-containing protein n=1 Tax=Xenotaenia resolanae TaxID=208358 RepID=A0ABV0X4S1_9TELE
MQSCRSGEQSSLTDPVKEESEDEQQMFVVKEVPDLWSSSLDQQNPELLQIKKEEEELWISQEGELLTVKIEDEVKLKLSELHHLKTEDSRDTEGPTCSSAEQMVTEPSGEECGGPEQDWKSDPNTHLQQDPKENAPGSSETEVSGEDDADNLSVSGSETEDSEEIWRETRKCQSGVNGNVGDKSSQKAFSCSECCSKQFVNEQTFKKHMTSHSGEKSSSCLVEKEEAEVRAGKKSVVCGECGKTFPYRCYLKSHMRIHTGEKPFHCVECDKTFQYRSSLTIHMTKHRGEKLFPCDVCDKKFYQKATLKQHMMIHKGEKPFACGDCDRHFRLKNDLRVHMLSHTGVKLFGCGFCNARFTRDTGLRLHIRRHTGEKPFACDKCDKRFVRNAELKRHVIYHAEEKPFICDVCGATFTRKSSLKTHKISFHENK